MPALIITTILLAIIPAYFMPQFGGRLKNKLKKIEKLADLNLGDIAK